VRPSIGIVNDEKRWLIAAREQDMLPRFHPIHGRCRGKPKTQPTASLEPSRKLKRKARLAHTARTEYETYRKATWPRRPVSHLTQNVLAFWVKMDDLVVRSKKHGSWKVEFRPPYTPRRNAEALRHSRLYLDSRCRWQRGPGKTY